VLRVGREVTEADVSRRGHRKVGYLLPSCWSLEIHYVTIQRLGKVDVSMYGPVHDHNGAHVAVPWVAPASPGLEMTPHSYLAQQIHLMVCEPGKRSCISLRKILRPRLPFYKRQVEMRVVDRAQN
jgi:hypothetical protein